MQGEKAASNGGDDIFIAGLDPANGALLWLRSLGGSGRDQARALAIGSAGALYLAGTISGGFSFGGNNVSAPNPDNVAVLKFKLP